jgi:hypothetical protein
MVVIRRGSAIRSGVGVVAVIAAMAMAGCGKDAQPQRDTAAAPTAATARPTGAAGGVACPRTGHWSECQIKTRLEQSGLAPRATTEKVGDLPTVSGKPLTYMLGNAGLAVYLYSDSSARHAAAAKLDTAKFIPPSREVSMLGEGTAIQSDNVLVLLFSRNEHQRERVADAITAGPPQP